MPRRRRRTRKRRRTFKRRRFRRPTRKRRKRRVKLAPILRKSVLVKLRYVEEITMVPGTLGDFAYTTYRANSINDPTFAVGGHQPMGHDQYQNLYEIYQVVGSKVTAKVNTKGTGNAVQYCTIIKSEDSTLASAEIDINNRLESGIQTSRIKTIYPVGSGRSNASVMATFSNKKDLSLNALTHTTRAAFGANPVVPFYYHICVGALGIAPPAQPTMDLTVTIDFVVLLSKPILVGQS